MRPMRYLGLILVAVMLAVVAWVGTGHAGTEQHRTEEGPWSSAWVCDGDTECASVYIQKADIHEVWRSATASSNNTWQTASWCEWHYYCPGVCVEIWGVCEFIDPASVKSKDTNFGATRSDGADYTFAPYLPQVVRDQWTNSGDRERGGRGSRYANHLRGWYPFGNAVLKDGETIYSGGGSMGSGRSDNDNFWP